MNGESLDSYTTVSFSIMICSSLVQSNQQDSTVLSVKVTMQHIKGKAVPVQFGGGRVIVFQEVKVPRFHNNGTVWW